jgi:Urea transporter
MSTEENDDKWVSVEEDDTTTTPTAAAAAVSGSASESDIQKTAAAQQTLKDLINVTNFVEGDDGKGIDEEKDDGAEAAAAAAAAAESEEQVEDSSYASDELQNPFQKVVNETVTSIRGGLDEHVAPKLQEFVLETQNSIKKLGDSIRGTHEQHVVPHLSKANNNIQEFGANTKKGLDEFGASTKRTMDDIGTNTKKGLDEFGENTKKTLDNIGQTTKRVVDTHIGPHLDVAKQTSVRAIDHVGKSTKTFVDEHVQPVTTSALQNSQRAINTTNQVLMEAYKTSKTYVYTNREYFWNSAPGLTCDTEDLASMSSSFSWYQLLEEATARSFGQVIYCNNPITGIFIWFAILWASPLAGLCSLICVVTVSQSGLMTVSRTCCSHTECEPIIQAAFTDSPFSNSFSLPTIIFYRSTVRQFTSIWIKKFSDRDCMVSIQY